MPIVTIDLVAGRTIAQKRELVAKVTQAVCEAIAVDASNVRIILQDMNPENYGFAGKLIMDQRDKT
jgi:4-oxalocrotonate tautomerase